MNRKQFIQSHGATCENWTWSWSFINEKEKFIIFGVWVENMVSNDDALVIFSEEWDRDRPKKPAGFNQSREHIRLIEDEAFKLKTFSIFHEIRKDKNGKERLAIKKFDTKLEDRTLLKIGAEWFARKNTTPNQTFDEEITIGNFLEGSVKKILVNAYERNEHAREICIKHYGYKCAACSFNFEETYGPIGSKFIHVHHIRPIAELKEEYVIDPIKDLVPVCPNCHAIIHRTKPVLTIDQMKSIIHENKQ